MNNVCNNLKIRTTKISELAGYSNLKSQDILYTIEKSGSNYYSRKTTFSDFVQSITQLTSSLSGNIKGNFSGNLTGSVTGNLTGSLNGIFNGKIGNLIGSFKTTPSASIKGINIGNISFDGITSYSVSSSHALISDNSNNSLSSSFALSTSYADVIYSFNSDYSDRSISSSKSITSSFADKSLFSKRSKKTNYSDYTYNGLKAESSSYSDISNLADSSSYAKSSSYATVTNYSFNSLSSSISEVAGFVTYPTYNFGMKYISSFDDATNRYSSQALLVTGSGTTSWGPWKKVYLSQSFFPSCSLQDSGILPPDTKYIMISTQNQNFKAAVPSVIAWCADINNPSEPRILTDVIRGNGWNDLKFAYVNIANYIIVPIKPGNPPSFYFKVIGNTSYSIALIGYIPSSGFSC